MSHIKEITPNEFSKKVLERKQPVLVHFYSDWCAPCLTQDLTIKKFAFNNKDDLDVLKVNVDRCPELARSYWITSVPTQILFKDGKPMLARVNDEEQLDQVFDFDEVA